MVGTLLWEGSYVAWGLPASQENNLITGNFPAAGLWPPPVRGLGLTSGTATERHSRRGRGCAALRDFTTKARSPAPARRIGPKMILGNSRLGADTCHFRLSCVAVTGGTAAALSEDIRLGNAYAEALHKCETEAARSGKGRTLRPARAAAATDGRAIGRRSPLHAWGIDRQLERCRPGGRRFVQWLDAPRP